MAEATLTGLFGAHVGVVGGNLLGVALNASGLALAAAPGNGCADAIQRAARAEHDDRLFVAGGRLPGAGVDSARDPRIAAANCGGIGPCLT